MMKKSNYLLLILSVFLFFGCRQENLYVDQESQNNSVLKNYVINGNEIKKDVNLWSKLSGIQTHLFSTDLKNKKNDPLLDGAVIMTDYAGVMEKNGVITYTFGIKRIHPSTDIENLVVRKNADGSYSGLLMQYHMSKQELQAFQNSGKPADIKGKISVYKINDINLNAKNGSYTYSEQVGCIRINYEVIPCTSQDQHTNPNQCDLTGVDAPQIILMSVDDTHCVPSGNPGGSSGTGTSPDGGNQGGGSGGSTNNPPANPYNTFIFDSFDDMYNTCASGDTACEAERQLNFQVQSYLLALSPTTSMLGSYTPIWKTVKDYLKTHGSLDDALTDKLVLTAKWFNAQNDDYTNPDFTLSKYKFSHWLLAYFLNHNQDTFDYFKSHPNDLEALKFKGIDYGNSEQLKMANILAPAFTELIIAQQNNTVSQVNIMDPFWKLAKDYMVYLIRKSVPEAIRYGRIIYEHANKYFKNNPDSLEKVNKFVEYMKAGVMVEANVQVDPHYMKWTDILLCWLFEIGDFPVNDSAGFGEDLPTIGFAGADYTISGQPTPYVIPMRHLSAHKMNNGTADPTSVSGLRNKAIQKIKQGDLSPTDDEWVFGSSATVDTIIKLDGMQFCIGSYHTNIYVTPLGNNQYKLTFIIKNKTGWLSGTRGLNDYDGNPLNDSIIPDQPRGTGVHLGGTIAQTYGWYEIITIN